MISTALEQTIEAMKDAGGITLKQIAEKTGIAYTSLCSALRGSSPISEASIEKLKALSLDDFKDAPKKPEKATQKDPKPKRSDTKDETTHHCCECGDRFTPATPEQIYCSKEGCNPQPLPALTPKATAPKPSNTAPRFTPESVLLCLVAMATDLEYRRAALVLLREGGLL